MMQSSSDFCSILLCSLFLTPIIEPLTPASQARSGQTLLCLTNSGSTVGLPHIESSMSIHHNNQLLRMQNHCNVCNYAMASFCVGYCPTQAGLQMSTRSSKKLPDQKRSAQAGSDREFAGTSFNLWFCLCRLLLARGGRQSEVRGGGGRGHY